MDDSGCKGFRSTDVEIVSAVKNGVVLLISEQLLALGIFHLVIRRRYVLSTLSATGTPAIQFNKCFFKVA